MTNPYNTLGIGKNATEADIKSAYRKLAMENHPDKGGNADKFAEVSNAYETLKDPQKRLVKYLDNNVNNNVQQKLE